MSQDLLTTPASTVKTAKSPQAAKTRLDFVDGLRGFAALYVVIAHALLNGWYAESGTRAARGLTLFDRIINLLIWPFSFGHGAVVLFIVLSGYSLMLAVARSNASSLPNGTLDFYRRRALRILPPYYVALVLAIGLFWFVPGFEAGTNTNLSAGQLLSHLILVHNWSSVDIYSIDGPMWSLAVEWQIYFLFPLILIPIWRKWGSLAVAVVSIGLGVAIQFLFDSTQSYIFAWFLGLFTLGMVAASICFSTKPEEVKWRTKLPWGKLCIGFLVIFGVYRTITKGDSEGATTDWFKDLLWGMVICCLLVAFTGVSQNKKRGNIIYRGLSHRWSVKLGQFSYSLYLVHQLILSLIAVVFAALGWKTGIYWLVLIVLGTPLAVASSYLFHIIFERPFMHPPSKANKPWQSQQLGEAQETVTTTS